ncbi:unnamed protein product, partial [Prorocentrum cordatum]
MGGDGEESPANAGGADAGKRDRGLNGSRNGDSMFVVVRNLPEAARGYSWFKRCGADVDVVKAEFFGLKPGQPRWAICEARDADEASSMVKALDGFDTKLDKPLAAEAVGREAREKLAGRRENAKGRPGAE